MSNLLMVLITLYSIVGILIGLMLNGLMVPDRWDIKGYAIIFFASILWPAVMVFYMVDRYKHRNK